MAKNRKNDIDSFSGIFTGETANETRSKGRPKTEKETKKSTNLALYPSVYADAQKIAYIDRISISELVGKFLEDYVKQNKEKIEEYERIKK